MPFEMTGIAAIDFSPAVSGGVRYAESWTHADGVIGNTRTIFQDL